jgi:choline-sulfatase
VRNHQYKYAACNTGEELLFDLARDPHELDNVVDEPGYQEALQAMRRELGRRWFDVERQYPLRSGQY